MPTCSAPLSPGRYVLLIVTGLVSITVSQANVVASDDPSSEFFFERRVRPVLAAYCVRCHGPDKQEANVRVDSRDHLVGKDGTRAIVQPGAPERSRILQVLSYEGHVKMPPTGPLPKETVAAIRDWIAAGAPWPETAPRLTSVEGLRAAATEHWALRPLRAPAIPQASPAEWQRTPVDAFILARLNENQLTPSPETTRRELCRRLYFDLLGMPPTFEETRRFENDERPDAAERLVDRLLASPHYGERWGRHWLDVARYADTKGYVFANEPRYPFAYTYRDYVISAFNEDKPFDQFVVEQLAADLLPESESDPRRLAALGFLTVGRRFSNNIHDIIDDRIDLVGRGLLGLTLACARCHEHKYDPISMEDYYALYGVFASCEEPDELPVIGPPEDQREYEKYAAELRKRKAAVETFVTAERQKLLEQLRKRTADYIHAAIKGVPGLDLPPDVGLSFNDDDLRPQVVIAWRRYLAKRAAPDDPVFAPLSVAVLHGMDRYRELLRLADESGGTPLNPVILRELQEGSPETLADLIALYARVLNEAYAAVSAGEADEATQALGEVLSEKGVFAFDERTLERLFSRAVRNRLNELRRAVDSWLATGQGGPPRAMVLVDRDRPVTPRIFLRGDPRRPGPEVPRRFVALLCNGSPRPFRNGSGRLELAQAIASEKNPLTARVFVNRVWMWHFGQPIVETVDDFGLRCAPPVHRELLDWLAARFIVVGWSVKRLHREMLLSATYRQSSMRRAAAMAVDPENRLYWRMNRRRLEFEPLWDSMLAVSGDLDLRMGGRPVNLFMAAAGRRRAVYGFIDRQDLAYILRIFDFASPDSSTPRRQRTIVPQQALFFLNSPFVLERAEHLATLPEVAKADTLEEKTRRLFRRVYQREPSEDELYFVRSAVESLSGGRWNEDLPESARNRVLTAVAQALLCANEFVYVD